MSRSLFLYLPVALAGLGAGAAYALWSTGYVDAPAVVAARDTQPAQQPHTRTQLPRQSLDLRLDERLDRSDNDKAVAKPGRKTRAPSLHEFARQEHAHKNKPDTPEPAVSPTSPERLNLKLPDADTDTLASIDSDAPAEAEVPTSRTIPPEQAFNFEPAPVVTPHAEDSDLFNKNNGLRGFMKQSWVNQSFAVQGGLGLNEKRITPDDNDLRDDVAVGMGVIFAF